jgi:hypothetical protein
MHSRYSIRDEAAQQSEFPPPMCDAIFNLNGQVLVPTIQNQEGRASRR